MDICLNQISKSIIMYIIYVCLYFNTMGICLYQMSNKSNIYVYYLCVCVSIYYGHMSESHKQYNNQYYKLITGH